MNNVNFDTEKKLIFDEVLCKNMKSHYTNALDKVKEELDKIPLVNASAEILDARGDKNTLGEKVRSIDASLDNKANKNEVFSMANMGQDVKEAMTGGSVAVVGKNTVLTENIVDKQVTEDKTIFFDAIQGKNLINISSMVNGFYVSNTDGTFGANASHKRTDYIPIKAGDYYFSTTGASVGFRYALYNSSKVFIKGELINTFTEYDVSKVNKYYYKITVAQDGYIACSFVTGLASCQLEYSTHTQWENYYRYYDLKSSYLNTVNSAIQNSKAPKMYVKKIGTRILIKHKYKNGFDVVYNFEPQGVNNTPSIATAKLIVNPSAEINDNFDIATAQTLMQVSTDLISPYVLDAVNNANGDIVPSGGFTGGWHGTTNLTGAPTSKNYKFDLYVDNKLITTDGLYSADNVEIVVVNKVQARNTVKNDGTGREVIQEKCVYNFSTKGIKVDVMIEALEDITLNTWYCIQSHNQSYGGKILFKGDNIHNKWQDVQGTAGTFLRCGNKVDSDLHSIIVTNGNGDNLELYVDKVNGLGNRRYMSSTGYIAMMNRIDSASNTKCYFYLVDTPLALTTGKIVSASGGWKLYYNQI